MKKAQKQAFESLIYHCSEISELLEDLPQDVYNQSSVQVSSVGGHIRHAIEFIDCFLSQSSQGRVNYDCRCRDQAVEMDTSQAQIKIKKLIVQLDSLKKDLLEPKERVPFVLMAGESACQSSEALCLPSSLEREILFLCSHTVHHLALVNLTLMVLGHSSFVMDGIGIAPSTQDFRATE